MSLLDAVHRADVDRAAALLFRGADVNVRDGPRGVTPLLIACHRGASPCSQSFPATTQYRGTNTSKSYVVCTWLVSTLAVGSMIAFLSSV